MKIVMKLDEIDKKILGYLQEDATMSVAEIGKKVGLSTTPCWRRIQNMEESGVISSRVALVDPEKVNAKVTVFMTVRTNQHSSTWLEQFKSALIHMDEVVEFYRISGEVDYLLRIMVSDMAAYDAFYKKLIDRIDLSDVSSSFAMEEIKYTTAIPLGFAASKS